MLGPAAALGVGARLGFADRVRAAYGVPVLNLGRGAAGPKDLLDAVKSNSIAPILAGARAVVIVLMAGRSSANSQWPYVPHVVQYDEHGKAVGGMAGEEAMARDAGKRASLRALPDPPHLLHLSLSCSPHLPPHLSRG